MTNADAQQEHWPKCRAMRFASRVSATLQLVGGVDGQNGLNAADAAASAQGAQVVRARRLGPVVGYMAWAASPVSVTLPRPQRPVHNGIQQLSPIRTRCWSHSGSDDNSVQRARECAPIDRVWDLSGEFKKGHSPCTACLSGDSSASLLEPRGGGGGGGGEANSSFPPRTSS